MSKAIRKERPCCNRKEKVWRWDGEELAPLFHTSWCESDERRVERLQTAASPPASAAKRLGGGGGSSPKTALTGDLPKPLIQLCLI